MQKNKCRQETKTHTCAFHSPGVHGAPGCRDLIGGFPAAQMPQRQPCHHLEQRGEGKLSRCLFHFPENWRAPRRIFPVCGQWGQPLARTPFPSPTAKSVCVRFVLSLATFCKQSKSPCRSKAGDFLVTDQGKHMNMLHRLNKCWDVNF